MPVGRKPCPTSKAVPDFIKSSELPEGHSADSQVTKITGMIRMNFFTPPCPKGHADPPEEPPHVLIGPTQECQHNIKQNSRMPATKRKSNDRPSFRRYIRKILTLMAGDAGKKMHMSEDAKVFMDNYIYDMFDAIAKEGGRLTRADGSKTLRAWHLQTAMRIVVGPGQLRDLAVLNGSKAHAEYFRCLDTCRN